MSIPESVKAAHDENLKLRALIQTAKHLLLAAIGPKDGPTNWEETREC